MIKIINHNIIGIGLVGALAFGSMAAAQNAAPVTLKFDLENRFNAADNNHDGKLTREEASAGGLPSVAVFFDSIDTQKKGYVTLNEIKTARDKLSSAHN